MPKSTVRRTDTCNGRALRQSDAKRNSHSYGDPDCYRYSNGDINADINADSYSYSPTHSNAKNRANAQAAAHAAPPAVSWL